MTELQIGFLYNAASCLSNSTSKRSQIILKSYYLMRCKEVTTRLPQKLFSKSLRCPHCCIEWNSTEKPKVTLLRLSKKQRRRIRFRQKHSAMNGDENISKGNVLVKTCAFCNHKTTSVLERHRPHVITENIKAIKKPEVKNEKRKLLSVPTNKTSVYSDSKQIFLLANQNNTLASIVKAQNKDIKNNKKKRDKFAGLCQKAVLSANKMKQDKEKQNKINLFLKPSM